jgi:hypothetical protein
MASECRLENQGGFFVCVSCGKRVTAISGDAPRSVCRQPGAMQKAANFAASAAKHVAAGMPQCSDEERERRFAICQGCEFYDGKACTKCGCPVVREKQFVSKLAWADSECPAGKWGKEAKKAVDNP